MKDAQVKVRKCFVCDTVLLKQTGFPYCDNVCDEANQKRRTRTQQLAINQHNLLFSAGLNTDKF